MENKTASVVSSSLDAQLPYPNGKMFGTFAGISSNGTNSFQPYLGVSNGYNGGPFGTEYEFYWTAPNGERVLTTGHHRILLLPPRLTGCCC